MRPAAARLALEWSLKPRNCRDYFQSCEPSDMKSRFEKRTSDVRPSAWCGIAANGRAEDLQESLGMRVHVGTEKSRHWYVRDRILREATAGSASQVAPEPVHVRDAVRHLLPVLPHPAECEVPN